MPELVTAGGAAVELDEEARAQIDQQFAAAMASDGESDGQAPPKRPAKSPADGAGDSRPRRGRPPKDGRARTAAAAPAALSAEQRANGVKGLVQVGAGLCLVASKVNGKDAAKADAFKADAVTLASSADQIADACVQTAAADPRFAAALDKVCSAGPYAALVSVMVGVGTQVARNHKPSLAIPGTVDPAELLKAQDEAEAAHAA